MTALEKCTLEQAAREWEQWLDFDAEGRSRKWSEIYSQHRPFIAWYKLDYTTLYDRENRAKTRAELMRLTVQFYAERGHAVTCQADPENVDGFTIYPASQNPN